MTKVNWASSWILALVGCSGGSFDVSDEPGKDTGAMEDTGSQVDATGIDTVLGDSGSDTTIDSGTATDGSGGDGIASDVVGLDGSACPLLEIDATDVYVDKFSATPTPGNGTKACPFRTIAEATALGATSGTSIRTIHVSGVGPATPVVYNEIAAIRVSGRVILRGGGPLSTKITGAGGIFLGYTVTVVVDQNATLDGFSIVNSSGSAILANSGASVPGGTFPTIKNTTASGNKENGIVVAQSAEVGPNFHADSNTKSGMLIIGSNPVHVSSTSGSNSFDSNTETGIYWSAGTGTLQFDGGSASSNGGTGIRLMNTATGVHRIGFLIAKSNGAAGLSVAGGNLWLRMSTLLKNKSFGLVFNYGSLGGNNLDIGTTLSGAGGGNTFGAVSSSERNINAGICLAFAGNGGSQAAESDKWSACSPVQTAVSGCDASGPPYADVWYFQRVGASGANPVNATGCGLGP